jgi:ferredoxin
MQFTFRCGEAVFYVDKNLCAGCGVCLDACGQGAITWHGPAVSIDETLCTSCGRCVDLCLTGAIIAVKTQSEDRAEGGPRPHQYAPPFPVETPAAHPRPLAAAQLTESASRPQPVAAWQLDLARRVVTGLINVAAYLVERRQNRVPTAPVTGLCSLRRSRWRGRQGTGERYGAGPARGTGTSCGMGAGRGQGQGAAPGRRQKFTQSRV